ncbi:MAG: hypothetical protein AAGA50_18750 [Pseudomonadota bacterium]
MPANRLDLPSNYNAVHVVGVTRGANKIRPTVYFATGSHFTQSHKSANNIGYHPPPGHHLFFGNVSASELDQIRANARAGNGVKEPRRRAIAYYQGLLAKFTDGTGQACQVLPPPLTQKRNGLVLLEVTTDWLHRSRSALEPVSYQEAVQIVRNIRGRTTRKLGPHQATGEYYFADQAQS